MLCRDDPCSPPWREAVIEAARQAAREENVQKGRSPESGFIYRWEHVQATVRIAIRLAELTGADLDTVEAAAWLHDVAKQDAVDHGRRGAIAARRILAGTDYPRAKIEAVADAIAKHVGLTTTQPVEPLEAAVLWDADKLTKLGAIAVLHFSWAEISHHQADTEQILSRLPDYGWQQGIVTSLNTTPARAAGRERLEVYKAFCRQAAREFDGRDLIVQAESNDLEDSQALSSHQPHGGDGGTENDKRRPT